MKTSLDAQTGKAVNPSRVEFTFNPLPEAEMLKTGCPISMHFYKNTK